jgi:hypothetical protein
LIPAISAEKKGHHSGSPQLRKENTGFVMIGATYGRAMAGEPAFCKVSHRSKANSTAAQNSRSL